MPAPDRLVYDLPEDHICLVTDDGTELSLILVRTLASRGWRPVLWRLPGSVVSDSPSRHLPDDIVPVKLPNLEEATLEHQLASVVEIYGPVGAFIYLAPLQEREAVLGEAEMTKLKHIFLLAKHIQPMLTAPAGRRAVFMTVSRMDGQLGLGAGMNFAAVEGGLLGLTKTLALEWPGVFCRAVDVCPKLDTPAVVQAILAELYDPNQLVTEVGISLAGRVTLCAT